MVSHTCSSHRAQIFPGSFHCSIPIALFVFQKMHFHLTSCVCSQLGKYGCHSHYPWWSQWPFGLKWLVVLSSHSLPGNRCHLERRKHGWTHWFPNPKLWQSRHWSRPNEKVRTLKCWGLVCSCWLLSGAQATPFIPGLCSVTQSFLKSVLYSEMMTLIHLSGAGGGIKITFLFF